ncbi:TrmH family RNA methyltransferase [Thauera aromatica]|uniref:23S rRNA (Guanosine-2'-O-)-methyltransferase rlmB n=1 Tax=Thauera aromatica K172 TaxID=44139 RepID=A0A2R4BNP9_THAAR|nr:RNA methyltransferase [Thauera aromatica]AVR88955.1 23S rRNA (guanosine-2'-O-) -methyltransferase rlmB [Thauera aromatica K172]MCK2096719.1 RNA methyltransferase [Thauera aromatica]
MKAIRARDNPTVKRLHALAHSARERRKSGETVLDGAHLVDAALAAHWPLKTLIVSESGLLRAEHRTLLERAPSAAERILLTDMLFAHVSPVDAPSGLLAVIDLPPAVPARALDEDLIVLDGVQDPGNLGTILRTAAAAGIGHALLTAGCTQAWSPRALRAGMGAQFVLRIEEHADAVSRLAAYPGRRLATALGEGARPLYALDLAGPVAWLFGAEGQGLSPALLAAADQRVLIPMAGGIESLNVGAAVAVCLFEQRRQRAVLRDRVPG